VLSDFEHARHQHRTTDHAAIRRHAMVATYSFASWIRPGTNHLPVKASTERADTANHGPARANPGGASTRRHPRHLDGGNVARLSMWSPSAWALGRPIDRRRRIELPRHFDVAYLVMAGWP
jgi:hypothetical protein